MNSFEAIVLWCALQATLVAGLGIAATWLLVRRSPGAAATAASAAGGTVLVLTLCAPAPWPEFTWGTSDRGAMGEASRGGGEEEPVANGEAVGGVDVRLLVERIRQSVGFGAAVRPQAPVAAGLGWVTCALTIGAGLGAWRLAAAFWYVSQLRASLQPVNDPAATTQFAGLARSMGVCGVELAETPRLGTPAIVGWRRPVVVLPRDRAGWSDEHLRAALAHELAHASRGDFAWRAAASAALALHAINPLVHLLVRRLSLAQEIAADRLAAAAVGGRAVYLRAMSELAIRLDDSRAGESNWLRAEPIVLPTFSSYFMRRIAMLRSKDGSAASGRRSAAGIAAAAIIALVGVGTMVIRGVADAAPGAASGVAATPAAGMFTRQPLDAASLCKGEGGVFVLRVRELSEQPAFAPLVLLGNSLVNAQLRDVLGGDAAPTLRLEAIECLAGEIVATQSTTTDAQGEEHGSFRASCEDFVIQFVDEVDWRAWIKQHVTGAEEMTSDGFAYIKLPGVAGLPMRNLLVAERDGRTLAFSGDVDRLRSLATASGETGNALAAELAAVDGGLIAIAANTSMPLINSGEAARIRHKQFGADDPAGLAMQTIVLNVKRLSLGLDIDAKNQSDVRASLGCDDQASAERVRDAFAMLQPAAQAYLAALKTIPASAAGSVRGSEQQGTHWYLELVVNATVTLEPDDEGRVDVRVTGQAPFPGALLSDAEVAAAEKQAAGG